MSNLWQWYQQYADTITTGGTPAQQNTLALYHFATWSQGANTLLLLRRARESADAIGETCFSLFLSHWITEHLLWYARHYEDALQNALAAVVKFQQEGAYCPVAERLYINLVEAYIEIDPAGYQTEIAECLAYVRDNVTMDYEGRCMMAFRQGLMHARLGDFEGAREQAVLGLSVADDAAAPPYYQALPTFVLGVVAFKNGDADALASLAAQGGEAARRSSPPVYATEFALWTAWAAEALGDPDAERYYVAALGVASRHADALSFAYYDALCDWLQVRGRTDEALKVRERQRKRAAERGNRLDAAEAALGTVALLVASGQNPTTAAQTAESMIGRLRAPERYRAQLAALLGGG
jgi:hypothetical protein